MTALLVSHDVAVDDRPPRGAPARADHRQAPDARRCRWTSRLLRRGQEPAEEPSWPTTRGWTCPKGASLEGFLAPATYRVLPDITADELIRQMLDKFYATVGPDRLKVAKSRGMTFYQVLTLASIVEREAVLDDERPLIAGVYQNRLEPQALADRAPAVRSDDLLRNDTHPAREAAVRAWTDYAFWAPLEGCSLDGARARRAGRLQHLHRAGPDRRGRSARRRSPRSTPPSTRTRRPATCTSWPTNDGSKTTAFAKTYKEHQANLAKYGYR